MFAVIVRFEVKPDRLAEFDALAAETLGGITGLEPGTLVYLTGAPGDDVTARVFVEVYADETAFEAHEATPHTRHFLAAREELLDSYRVEFVRRAEGKLLA